ncbi:MAG: type II toxin-antitoxin system RelE/ParE family toxin [Spirochaetales bacterium]|nr:type II toxin-antitoxin system RelE/ParE family toxin [Spirochaetales bacterium]
MPKKKYSVLIYPLAEQDMDEIILFLKELSLKGANAFLDKLSSKLNKLEEYPEMFPLVKDERLSEKGYRIIPVDNYIVFYVVMKKNVQVRRMIYGKRNYFDFL